MKVYFDEKCLLSCCTQPALGTYFALVLYYLWEDLLSGQWYESPRHILKWTLTWRKRNGRPKVTWMDEIKEAKPTARGIGRQKRMGSRNREGQGCFEAVFTYVWYVSLKVNITNTKCQLLFSYSTYVINSW